MRRSQRASGWFAALRRDRLLFAFAAIFLLLAHLFQPLAEARAADSKNVWVICTIFGMQTVSPDESSTSPDGVQDHCPTCIGGPCAGMAAPLRLSSAFEEAFPSPEAISEAMPRLARTKLPPAPLNEPPPAIRAPPAILA
jgi:hypothetical protein